MKKKEFKPVMEKNNMSDSYTVKLKSFYIDLSDGAPKHVKSPPSSYTYKDLDGVKHTAHRRAKGWTIDDDKYWVYDRLKDARWQIQNHNTAEVEYKPKTQKS